MSRPDPLLRRALGAWRRFPLWALAATVAVAAWMVATVTAPLTTDAAADRAFSTEADLAATAAPGRGLDARATTASLFDDELLGQVSDLLTDLDVYEPAVATVTPLGPYSGSVAPSPFVRNATGSFRAMVYARDGLLDQLELVDGAPADDGVLLPDTAATELGAHAGDTVEIGLAYPRGSGFESPPPTTVTVAGVYRTADGLPFVDGAAPGWQLPNDPVGNGAAAVMITARPTALLLLGAMQDRPLVTWDLAFGGDVNVERGRDAADAVDGATRQFRNPNSLIARRIADADAREVVLATAVGPLVDRSERAAQELAPVVTAIAVTARVVSAGTLVLAVFLLCRARRRELELATAIGLAPLRIALIVTVELALSVIVGVAIAYSIVRWSPNVVAGDGHIDSATLDHAVGSVLRWAPAGFVAVAAAALVAAWGTDTAARSRVRHLAAALDPLTILVVAALATGAQLVTQAGPALESGSSLLFPTIAILAVTVAAARIAGWLVTRSGRRRRTGRPPQRQWALWFATRRLRASLVELTALFIVIAAGVGLFVYDTSVSDGAERGLDDKAAALGAAPTVASLESTERLAMSADGFPVDLPPRTTVVWRPTFAQTGSNATDVLVVDPATFAEAVEWRDSFADRPLDDLLADIADSPDGTIDVILAGNYNDKFDDSGTLGFVSVVNPVKYRVIARIAAGPWQRLRAPLMIADQRSLAPLLGDETGFPLDIEDAPLPTAASAANLDRVLPTFIWSQLPARELAATMSFANFDGENPDLGEARRQPEFVAVLLSLPYLDVIGLATLGVAVAAVIVLGSRRRGELAVELAIARQMGVPRRSMLASGVVAAAGVAVIAAAVGAATSAVLVHVMTNRLDPAPEYPPGFVADVSWTSIAIATGAVALAAVAGAWIDDASARRRPVSEVLRGAD